MKISKKKIVIFFIITILVIPFIIHALFKINCNIYFFQAEWTAGDVLTAYASLLGAGATIIAVIITINYENGLRRKENIIKIKPFLICKPTVCFEDVHHLLMKFDTTNCTCDYCKLQWNMINVSENVANNISFGDECFYIYNEITEKYDIYYNDLLDDFGISMFGIILSYNHIIEPKSSKEFYINFSISKKEDNFIFGSDFSFIYLREYFYTDLSNIKQYKNVFKMLLTINIDVNNEVHLFVDDYYNIDSQ